MHKTYLFCSQFGHPHRSLAKMYLNFAASADTLALRRSASDTTVRGVSSHCRLAAKNVSCVASIISPTIASSILNIMVCIQSVCTCHHLAPSAQSRPKSGIAPLEQKGRASD